MHFQQQTSVTAKWYKKGSKPKVKSFPGKSKISYSGFVIPDTGVLFTKSPDKFDYLTSIESVRAFLEDCPAPIGKKYAIVMDNAPWHKKMYRLVVTENSDEYSDIRDKVVFILLPPYSPDLNPIEQVWRITRRDAKNNKYFSDASALEEELDDYYSVLSKPNETLRSLCSFEF